MWDNVSRYLNARVGAAATVYSVASGAERHTKRRTTRPRGRAARDRQLGRVQVKILRWLLQEELRVERHGTAKQLGDTRRNGVAWTKVHLHLGERPSAVSEALRGVRGRSLLERRLVSVTVSSGDRVTRVRLTPTGRVTAQKLGMGDGGVVSPRRRFDDLRELFEQRHGAMRDWPEYVRARFSVVLQAQEDAATRSALEWASEDVSVPGDLLGRLLASFIADHGRAEWDWDAFVRYVRDNVTQKPED